MSRPFSVARMRNSERAGEVAVGILSTEVQQRPRVGVSRNLVKSLSASLIRSVNAVSSGVNVVL